MPTNVIPMRRNLPTAPVETWTPEVLTHWMVPGVREAIEQHENGVFQASALLADQLRRDPRICATLDTRVLGALGLPYSTNPADVRAEKRAQDIADRVHAWWFLAMPESTLAEAMRWLLLMGFVVGEIVGVDIDGEMLPRLVVHHPQFVEFWPYAIGGDPPGWYLQTRGGRIRITPGDGRWFLATLGGERPWMNGLVRTLAEVWVARKLCFRDWNRRSEVEGVGVRVAEVPDNAKPEHVDAFFSAVSRLGAETTLKLRTGYKFDLKAVQLSASQAFEQLISRCDMEITLAILGQNLTTQVDGGSYAAASVHARVQLDRLEADIEILTTVLREQVIKPWGRYNVEGWTDEIAPWPCWDTAPPDDKQKVAQSYLTLSQALPSLMTAGIDIAPLLERFGLKKGAEPTKPEPQVAPPAAQDPNGTDGQPQAAE
jgi:phage gp29-like protein